MAIKIFVDQGHNPYGFNAGAEGFGLREQDVTYMVGAYLADLLSADDRFEVRTSRPNKTIVLGYNPTSSLKARTDAANNWPADYFISLHCNASDNPDYNGTEAYVTEQYSEAYFLAEYIVAEIVRRVGTRNNLVRINPNLYVLKNTTMPSVLVELAYITNYQDNLKLRTMQYQFAYAIYVGLLNYFGFSQLSTS